MVEVEVVPAGRVVPAVDNPGQGPELGQNLKRLVRYSPNDDGSQTDEEANKEQIQTSKEEWDNNTQGTSEQPINN